MEHRFELIPEREKWREKLAAAGLRYHSVGGRYWIEGERLAIPERDIELLERATRETHLMYVDLAEDVCARGDVERLGFPAELASAIDWSFKNERDLTLMGRFDFLHCPGEKGMARWKCAEYNADCPTLLIESSVAQWFWAQETAPGEQQFNQIHEKLVDRFAFLKERLPDTLHVAGFEGSAEEACHLEYVRDCAIQGGFVAKSAWLEQLEWNAERFETLKTPSQESVETLYKIAPWEWLFERGVNTAIHSATRTLEPMWKAILSNKGALAMLWERHEGHPCLLPSFLEPGPLSGERFVKKPFFSRSGQNMSLYSAEGALEDYTDGYLNPAQFLYQRYAPIDPRGGRFLTYGSWVVGEEPAGLGVRESSRWAANERTCLFLPHVCV